MSSCRRRCSSSLMAVAVLMAAAAGIVSCCTRLNIQNEGRNKQRAVCSFKSLEDVPTMHNEQDVEDFLLTKNHIRNLHDNSFSQYVNVSMLILDQNLIEQISENAFKPLKKLRRLDISKNYLNIRDNRFLRPLHTLQELHMGNLEVVLDRGFFESQRDSLVVLSLEGTVRLEIREGAFSGLHRLRVLNLTNCNLKTLTNTGIMVSDFDSSPLRILSLADNPWECDCRLRWLIRWHQKKQREQSGLNFPGIPACAGPRENTSIGYRGMTGVKLFDASTKASRFQCLPEVYVDASSKTLHRVNEGDNVTMTCSFFSDPKGTAVWLFGSEKPNTVLPLQPSYHAWQSAGDTNFVASLAITSVSARDSRLYMCSVSNERGNASLVHRVTVDTTRSAMVNRKLVIIVSIGAVIVITCALMIGGVFFYHYTRSGGQERRRRGPGQKVQQQQMQQQQMQQQQLQQQQQIGYSQLRQSRESNGYYSTAVSEEAPSSRKQQHQRLRLATASGSETLAAVPLTAELPLDASATVDFRSATLPSLGHQHNHGLLMQHHGHGPGECPVHGSTRQLFPLCPVHGGCSPDSRADTPGSAALPQTGTRPSQAAGASGAAPIPRPCPLHGDLYATIGKSSSSASSAIGVCGSAAAGTAATTTYVRASKVDDCIPEGSDLLLQQLHQHQSQHQHQLQHQPLDPAMRLPAVGPAASGHKTNPQDDEGYSTAV